MPAKRVKTQADYFEIAEQYIPGAAMGAYIFPDKARFIAVRGEGSRVQSAEGRWYIDYNNGAGANILGHCHPAVVEAVQQQAARGLHYFGTLNDTTIELAEKLVQHIPCAEQVVFATTGSEATLYAMRLARAFTGRDKILKFEGGYHGNHDYAAVSVFSSEPAAYPLGMPHFDGMPAQIPQTMLVAPYNDLETVERIVAENAAELAAIIVEPVQRIIFPQPGFLQDLRDICDRYDVLLIFDEIVTGFRLALGGAQEYFDVAPDLAAYGKIVGGGGPLSCVAGRADVLERASPRRKGKPGYAWVNGTLHGNPIAAAAGLATIAELEKPSFYEELHAKSDNLRQRLQQILYRHEVGAIAAGQASFWQILFMDAEPRNAMDIVNSDRETMRRLDVELLRRGSYVLPGGRRFICAVNTEEDFAQTEAALDEACKLIL